MKETPVQRFAAEIVEIENIFIQSGIGDVCREKLAAILEKVAEDAAEQERDRPRRPSGA